MSDLIDRQDAIGILDQYTATLNPDRDNAELGRVDWIRRFIEQLPSAQPKQRWIPCNERYPEQDERVIVTCGSYDFYVWDCMPNRGDDYFWEDEQGLYHNKYEAIAWFPLPVGLVCGRSAEREGK